MRRDTKNTKGYIGLTRLLRYARNDKSMLHPSFRRNIFILRALRVFAVQNIFSPIISGVIFFAERGTVRENSEYIDEYTRTVEDIGV